jgi:hypothetical protein
MHPLSAHRFCSPLSPRRKRDWLALWLILALFLVLHGLYNWAVPLGEGPDEAGHLAYVLFLAFEARLPVQRPPPALSDVPGEGHQPPLAYALAVPAVAWLPPTERKIFLQVNPDFSWAGGTEPAAFLRASREHWPWHGLSLAWHMARAVSGLAGAATITLTYLAARRLRPADPTLAILAALLVAFNPQLLFISALVSNDALLAALGAALLWHALARPVAPLRWALLGGLLFGLALLTKQSALLLGPLLLWASWRLTGGAWRRAARLSLLWMGTALLVAGWWYARNLWLYGDPFGLGLFQSKFATQPFAWGEPAAWAGALRQLFGSFWARFGWMNVYAPAWALWAYAALCALALVGWASVPGSFASAPQGSAQRLARPPLLRLKHAWLAPALAAALAALWTLAFAYTAGLVAWQGRMLFPALGALALLLAGGLRSWLTPSRTLALGVGLLALAAWMPPGVIRPAYHWIALAPQVAQAELGNPAYARYAADWERGVTLRGWRLDRPAYPGVSLPVTLSWHSLERIPLPWTVFVHLVDDENQIVAQSNRQPHADSLPFPRWTAGDWMADTHLLELPHDLPPGAYQLRVGLFLPEAGGRRQLVWDGQGNLSGDLTDLGLVQVTR